MSWLGIALLSAVAVAPMDRLAMADRLFNKGEWAYARAEYAALSGEKGLAEDDILYRLAECDRMLGKKAEARASYAALLEKHPTSAHADRARLMNALCAADDATRVAELKLLDSDRVAADLRATALYHIGAINGDREALERSVKLDPKGRYAPYARFKIAALLGKSADAAERRKSVELLLEIAFGGDKTFAEEALYLASAQSYADRRYDEAGSLLRRYLKAYAEGRHAAEARTMAAWCDYLNGRYADAAALCGEGKTDDLAFLRAACAQATGDAARAIELYRKYLADFPEGRNRKRAELPLARLEFNAAQKSGNVAGTIEGAKRAWTLSKDATDGLRLAWAYEMSSNTTAAVALYEEIAKAKPKSAEASEACFRRAMIHLRASRWDAAELALAEALGGELAAAKKSEALYWRGIAATKAGHAAEGAAFLQQAIASGLALDHSREARLILAERDRVEGREREAKEAYAKLVTEGACERMTAQQILTVGRLLGGEGARVCAKALTERSDAAWRQTGWALLGETEEASENYSAAIAAYRQCLAEPVKSEAIAAASVRLGELERRAGDVVAAETTLKQAITLNAGDAKARSAAYLSLAKLSEEKRDWHGARAYATVIVTLFENLPEAAEAQRILKEHPEDVQ